MNLDSSGLLAPFIRWVSCALMQSVRALLGKALGLAVDVYEGGATLSDTASQIGLFLASLECASSLAGRTPSVVSLKAALDAFRSSISIEALLTRPLN